ncbi:voltage-dependent calcium channel subunit alpha-2/delta-2-like [Tubulanus polymorphus]|uniref:voltage-dependent calcium channel subunit alpha-2/delta-2-like n=1 Tax=Tubulanus polymorphus TaxID=672921 RepID=UPI003DA541AD
MDGFAVLNIILVFLITLNFPTKGTYQTFLNSNDEEDGNLSGDVQNWAVLIQNYILQLASDGIKREYTQSYFDKASYTFERKDGMAVVRKVRDKLGDYFSQKKKAAQRIADKIVELYEEFQANNGSSKIAGLKSVAALSKDTYKDSDVPSRLPDDMIFSPYFKQKVSLNHSTVKISDEVPRTDRGVIDTVMFTKELEEIFKQNAAEDRLLRWQYFGSITGVLRMYPGREWETNFAGFYNDYDPRTRPWYIAATSGPKDVVIVLDCSISMNGEKFTIAKAVAKTVINTLTKQDYLNVVCARASHWDEVGKWHYFDTEVLSCQRDKMVPATVAHRKDLIEKIYSLKPGGTSEMEKGFDMAFDLLQSQGRTGCHSLIVFVTDGKDTDGENVRCGPGYYTRSGYVPGPICKYNWTKVWDVVERLNFRTIPQARIFSYLTKDDGEVFPGRLACANRGSLRKLENGENLITQMHNYFGYLSQSSKNFHGLWTSPYLDAWGLGLMVTHAVPAISKDGTTIGVAGIDATLDEIENFLTKHQWGSVTSFLMNNQGQVIFHPLLKQSTTLVDDPIFIPIRQLEQDKEGQPEHFNTVEENMRRGQTGKLFIKNARRGIQKGDYRAGVKFIQEPVTYYYSALNDSEYSFAFTLAETDTVFRRSQQPQDLSKYWTSYFNLLIEYNRTKSRKELPGTFEDMKVLEDTEKYPGLRVTEKYSSIFLAPKCHCDANKYFYDDDLVQKTIDAHRYINSYDPDIGCAAGGKYEKGIRADVLISQPIEEIWRKRNFESIDQVKWTYVGMRSGVFRTYPGHRSRRTYDPTKRPWYLRTVAAPDKTSVSTPYMDSAGVGKIITISQAVFEGMMSRTNAECQNKSKDGRLPGGCICDKDEDCIIGYCYISKAPGLSDSPRCATERVEAVTSLDIAYNDFHDRAMKIMESSTGERNCGMMYNCPDGSQGCQTRCYLFDNRANIIVDADFKLADALDTSKYKGVTLGKKEGEVMKELVYVHKFFHRTESIDFQGSCSISPSRPKVTLIGIPTNPEALDDYYKDKGPIPKFSNEYGCIQDVVGYEANYSALGLSGMITGNVSGPCMSGFYYVTSLPKTNLFLLTIENWKRIKEKNFYNFNCKIAKSIVNSGAYRIINGTCAQRESSQQSLRAQGKCPLLREFDVKCYFQHGNRVHPYFTLLGTLLILCITFSIT